MQKSDMYDFLVRAAIPPVTEEKNTPEELWEKKAELKKGSKEENRERTKEAEEFNRNEWIWRSVYRAQGVRTKTWTAKVREGARM
ncbi:hypothetical protein, partial [Slackia exigua]|uniref:hypothetical protein n=1 Tax=Slackia exigua TaxID=84109 RepID=UPI0028E8E0C5